MYVISCLPFDQLSPADLYEILKLRHLVFGIEQHCLYVDADGYDQAAYHLIFKNEVGQIVAYTRLFGLNMPYAGYLSIGRVVTHPDFRQIGLGKKLMKESIERVRNLFGKHPIKIGAQGYLAVFYSALGFKDIGSYYLEDGIPHLKMVLD
ncbi:MAG: GNAT family N-acetyltransferase [Saprospiraceae bacterium]